jgi:DNA-binding beta-propeller fold protein YncE
MTRRTVPSLLLCLLPAVFIALIARPSLAAEEGKDKEPPVVTIDSPAGGGTVFGAEFVITGSVTDNVAVRSATLKVNSSRPITVPLDDAGRFAVPVALRFGKNRIKLKAKDTSGKTTKVKLRFHCEEAPAGITITTPGDGDVIHAGHVDVRGFFGGPVKSMRFMPGMRTVPGGFSIEALPLIEGEARDITLTGFDGEGTAYTSTIHVSSTSAVEPLTLTADSAGGEVPLTVTFSLVNNTLESITSYEIDFTGSGEYATIPGGIGGLTHTYEQEGLAVPTVRVHTAGGRVFSGHTVISPYGRARYLASTFSNDPVDLEVDEQGRLYILERFSCRVVVTDADFSAIATFGSCGQGPGKFLEPAGIGLDHDGNVYVADAGTDTVQVFSPAFEHTATWGRSGSGRGEISGVRGIDVEYDGSVLLADKGSGRVDEFRADGTFTGDAGQGELLQPRDVVWTGGGDFAVSDSESGQVLLMSTGRTISRAWKGELPELGVPAGLAYDRHNGWLLIADEEKNRVTFVMEEKRAGIFVRHIDALEGDSRGLSHPTAAATAKSPVENIYFIADAGNRRIVKVRLPDDEGSSPADTWTNIREALSAGDIEGALAHFSPRTRERYRKLFTNAGTQLPVIVQDMSEIHPLSVTQQQAVYGVLRYDDGKPFLFEVVFVRDGPGDWKILQW